MTTQTKQIQTEDKKQIVLSTTETSEIEQTFNEARDFRSIGEKITAPLDSIISETAKIIDKDPIMNVSNELEKMNGEVQDVYKDIIDNDGTFMKIMKSIPIVGSIANSVDKKIDEAKFNMKGMEGKIGIIFSGFDQSYESINTSIDMQKQFVDGIEANLGKVVAYKEYIETKIVDFKSRLAETTDPDEKMKLEMFIRNVEYFQSNLIVLIGNLDMAKKRLLMRLDSANKLSLAMNSSRPIFKTLLSTALIESSSQKAIDASMKAMDVMGSTIDKMSSELTDRAISSAKKSEEMAAKPVLSNTVFIENVTKLKNHFDEIDEFRLQVKREAEKEKVLFNEAKTKLENIKVLSKESQEELAKELG
ncbi:MAG: hypothetical protein PHS49_04285 [Candidatus Gracilibacteria bacterium]|nr:hypothetical protein [Candidatus Gracilibacteria bacterium]